jgi:hypothetical protein
MKKVVRVVVATGGVLSFAVAACIFPDKDIQVIVTDKCGERWVASTVGAKGTNGIGQWVDIKTDDDEWLSTSFCVTKATGLLLQDIGSNYYGDTLFAAIAKCEDRAYEMGLGNNTCSSVATVSYVETCAPTARCEESTETGEGGDSGGETGEHPDFGSLDLTGEVALMRGIYVVSQLLIDTAIADPLGVSNDGTTATQLLDSTGTPYGFEIDGVTSTNLGGVLGLQNGDVVTEVSGYPTATYDDLLDVAGFLLSTNSATLELQRGTSIVVLTYSRGS